MLRVDKKFIVPILVAVFAAAGLFSCPSRTAQADTAEEIRDDMDDLQKEKKEAEAELASEQAKLYKNQSQIAATKARVAKIATDIASKEKELKNLNDRAMLNKAMLAEYIRQAYYANQENDPLLELSFFQSSLADMMDNPDNMLSIKARIVDALQVIQDAKIQTEQTKTALADQKDDHQQALRVQQVQQAEIVDDIQETQDTLANIQKKFAELQSDLNALLGTNYDAKDIKDAVRFASDRTGVPKGVLYGFLKKETDLGRNTGQCTYADVKKVSIPGYKKYGKKYQASIDRLYKREKLFYGIVEDLGYSKNKKVSCTLPFSTHGPNQGGAMGVAQFMSDTWLAYEVRVSSQTGHSKPDPWNITDGVMAMALKVKSAGGASDSASAIRKATINYYGAFSQGYYDVVLYWSRNYKKLL